ncbi:L-methionine transporter [Rickenella mellea]|uniref:L-methionine transporter n=1 Tax=Rickenella mellea TaxID=50990 RepID=A0A4Y7QD58_9AGAM|nr:L-methionine transporter [Rickenella mellea]
MGPSSTSSGSYIPMRSPRSPAATYPPSPPLSRSSHESDDSLRALELSDGPIDPTPRRAGRSYSVSGFHFQHDLLPLTTSLSESENKGDGPSEKNISLVSGIALVVGLQIGSGIFSSPGVVVANTHSVGASLLVWLASGLLGWTGASSFAELGSAIPLNGGAQAYLAYAYNPLVSYLFAWTAITALKPGGNGVIALIFAEYLNRLIWHATAQDVAPDALPQWSIKITACLAVVFVTILCIATRNLGTRAAVVFTSVKIASLFLIAVLGVVQLARGRASSSLRDPLFTDSSTSPSAYALALYSGLWAFDGWDQANYVGGEMKNPDRNIPRAIHSSMLIVTLLFLLTNVSYFVVLDKNTVGLSNTVALDFGRALFGPIGGSLFAFMVAFSCFGALNGSFYTSARLIYVAAKEGYLPKMFGRLHKTRKTPLNAMLLQAAITMTFIVFGGGFRRLINFAVVASWAFYFMTVLGLVILRVKEPDLPRPYRTWIITPLTFCAVALFLLCMPIIAAPLEALAVLGFVLAGVPVYYLTSRPESAGASRLALLLDPLSACISRLRGEEPRSRSGWTAVATEGDADQYVIGDDDGDGGGYGGGGGMEHVEMQTRDGGRGRVS